MGFVRRAIKEFVRRFAGVCDKRFPRNSCMTKPKEFGAPLNYTLWNSLGPQLEGSLKRCCMGFRDEELWDLRELLNNSLNTSLAFVIRRSISNVYAEI